MPQRKTIFIATMYLMLAGCNSAQDSASHALDTAGTETGASYNKVRDIFDLGHKAPPKTKPADARYCYKTYEDIICYSKPLPGEEYRLVGYQSASGKTGYTLPSKIPHTQDDASSAPTAIQPLPVPGGSDTDKDKQLKEIIFDPGELEPKELVPDKPQ